MMQNDFDLIIVGGGLVGNSLALALHDSGLGIALIEVNTQQQSVASAMGDRALALSAGTVEELEKLGIWQGVADKATPITDIHVSDRGHFGKARLSARKENVNALGYVIIARDIESHVAELVNASDVVQIRPGRVVGLSSGAENAYVSVEVADQSLNLSAKLVVGADGGNSSVRKLLGIDQQVNEYRQTAIVTSVKTELPHHNTAYERFTDSGPLALLPVNKKHCAVVWTREHETAQSLIALTDAAFQQQLQSCFGYRLGRLTVYAPKYAFPVSLIRAKQINSGRALIIGNAAHQLHPVAGQGFNLGLRDVTHLVSMLRTQIENGGDIGEFEFLNNYVSARKQDHDRTIGFTDSLVRLFSNESLLMAGARNLGLTVFDHMPFAKSILSRHAMGLAQKLPISMVDIVKNI